MAVIALSGRSIIGIAFSVLGLMGTGSAQAGACENLVLNIGLTGGTVSGAVTVPGPSFTAANGVTYTNLPSFCKVSAILTPTTDSFINVELWMPTTSWNGRFQGIGNGGYGGTIAQGSLAMVAGLQSGFAVASTDMGTAPSSNGDADALIGHPEKWIDFGSRATHLMTTLSKQLIQQFYAQGPQYSYFNGCSTGGQQGLMSAQRYPDDYDGILVGDAANNRTHVHTAVLWDYQASHKSPLGLFFSTDQTKAMDASIVQACAVKSGGLATDPFLTDPRACDWDPAVMQCTGAPDGICLTADQVATARAKYSGPRDPVTGKQIYPGLPRGSEADSQFGWAALDTEVETPFGSLFKWVFGPTFTYMNFNFDSDMSTLDSILASALNANSTDLSRFSGRNGKIIAYHGWADPLASPQEAINYYERLVAAQGSGSAATRRVQSFYRLFMVPGMYHCGYGPGPNAFGQPYTGQIAVQPPLQADAGHDIFLALQQWVEKGVAPQRVVAAKYVSDSASNGVQMTRPLCVYPNVARYSGSGDPNSESSFICAPAAGKTDPAQVPAPEYLN
ncbi:tannase/feruloyl esterase family alpha/beta hydrolase [Noviherbaspirillum pedocola]|uniref:Tannase/feruloyl esterase family alpha/beta hydrolase n=1 Tax=Noviherbaspirillum pedocola TaxID=2801341 RepID=A0A934T086_9BURK|nr:tannase/feruloyl esterase family alpha/beta hydrolase [Noviherbaspirillum pedocola]MBK4739113.1 tannase/feruloyl esterase family alpha/beta hydrolase [Noviherbaspirillum pedocola]